MPDLFSEIWMKEFSKLWNTDREMIHNLAGQDFNAKIGYGFVDMPNPVGLLIVSHGKIEMASSYKNQEVDWDLRASVEDWQTWLDEGLGLARLGFAVAHRKLQFKKGDYRKMLHTPQLAKAFLRSFELMTQIETQFNNSTRSF